jgi:hypothetical protein
MENTAVAPSNTGSISPQSHKRALGLSSFSLARTMIEQRNTVERGVGLEIKDF